MSPPLSGRRILVTRPRGQASALADQLAALGAEPILIPTIELALPTSYDALDAAIASANSFDWLLFTSANAVHAFAERAQHLGLRPQPQRIAVIGPATLRAVEAVELTAPIILMPPQYIAESLADALRPHAPGAHMLLVRAAIARDVLPSALGAAGATVTLAEAYRTLIPPASIDALRELFAEPASYPTAITFTSASTVINLVALLEAAALRLPPGIVLASIGPITSQALHDLGLTPALEAPEATIPSLVSALTSHFQR